VTVDVPTLLLAAIFGAAMGVFYYGGLWLTVQRLSRVENPTLWSNLSLLIRVSVMLGLCYFFLELLQAAALVAFVGFLVARSLVMGAVHKAAAAVDQRDQAKRGAE
jgi:F1F0 ATPase subunit 2